jgi:hypothetical protein
MLQRAYDTAGCSLSQRMGVVCLLTNVPLFFSLWSVEFVMRGGRMTNACLRSTVESFGRSGKEQTARAGGSLTDKPTRSLAHKGWDTSAFFYENGTGLSLW